MQARYYVFGLCKYLAWILLRLNACFPVGFLLRVAGEGNTTIVRLFLQGIRMWPWQNEEGCVGGMEGSGVQHNVYLTPQKTPSPSAFPPCLLWWYRLEPFKLVSGAPSVSPTHT